MVMSFSVAVLRLVGIWPGSRLTRSSLYLHMAIVHFVAITLVIYMILAQTFMEIAEGLYILSLNVIASLKVYNILWNMKSIKILVEYITLSYASENKILKTAAFRARWLSITFFSLCIFTGVNFLTFPLLDSFYLTDESRQSNVTVSERKLPFKTWMPHTNETPVYVIMYFLLGHHSVYMGYITACFDGFYVSLTLLVCGQLKVLQSAMYDIFVETGFTERQITSSAALKDKISRVTDHDSEVHRLKKCLEYLVKGPGDLVSKNRPNSHHRRLVQAIEHHESLIRFVDEMNTIFSPVMLVQFVASLALICLTGFQILTIRSEGIEFTGRVCYLVSVTSELFLLSWCGEQLIEQSSFVANAAYDCDWLSGPTSFRRDLQLVILRAQRPLSLTAGNFTVLAMGTFTSIVQVSYSFFTLLVEALDDQE